MWKNFVSFMYSLKVKNSIQIIFKNQLSNHATCNETTQVKKNYTSGKIQTTQVKKSMLTMDNEQP